MNKNRLQILKITIEEIITYTIQLYDRLQPYYLYLTHIPE